MWVFYATFEINAWKKDGVASILWQEQEEKGCRTDYTMFESQSYWSFMGSCAVLVLDPIFLLPHNLHLSVAQVVGDSHPGRWEGQLSSRQNSYGQCWMAFHCGYTGAECKTLSVRLLYSACLMCCGHLTREAGHFHGQGSSSERRNGWAPALDQKKPSTSLTFLLPFWFVSSIAKKCQFTSLYYIAVFCTWLPCTYELTAAWYCMCWLGWKISEWDASRTGFLCPGLVVLLWFPQLPANLWKWQIFTLKTLQLKSKINLAIKKPDFIVCSCSVAEA